MDIILRVEVVCGGVVALYDELRVVIIICVLCVAVVSDSSLVVCEIVFCIV